MKMYGQVYLIINDIDGKVYIGKTKQTLEKRLREHLYAASIEKLTHNSYFYFAIKKHGKEHFKNIHPICQGEYRKELINLYETYCIAFYRQLLG